MTHHPKYDQKHSCVWKNYWLSLLIVPECPQRPDPLQRRDSMFQADIICLVQSLELGLKNHVSSKSEQIGISLCTKTWGRMLIYFTHSKYIQMIYWMDWSFMLFVLVLSFFGAGPAKRFTRWFQASWDRHIKCNLDSLEHWWKLKTTPAPSRCFFFGTPCNSCIFLYCTSWTSWTSHMLFKRKNLSILSWGCLEITGRLQWTTTSLRHVSTTWVEASQATVNLGWQGPYTCPIFISL